jgi:hypothetical protein
MEYKQIKEQLLIEMATVVSKFGFTFRVYTEPQGNPSFHIEYKNEWEVVLQISDFRILESKYGDFKKGEQLPNKVKKILKGILSLKKEDITYWKVLLILWNALNEKYLIDTKTKFPY